MPAFVHQGMTSSDVLDTCLAVQLKEAGRPSADRSRRIARGAEAGRAFEHKYTPTIGAASHGVHAEPTTFGLKARRTLCGVRPQPGAARRRARGRVAICAISGAVGTFANIDPRVEAHVADKLGLKPEPISTQVIPP